MDTNTAKNDKEEKNQIQMTIQLESEDGTMLNESFTTNLWGKWQNEEVFKNGYTTVCIPITKRHWKNRRCFAWTSGGERECSHENIFQCFERHIEKHVKEVKNIEKILSENYTI